MRASWITASLLVAISGAFACESGEGTGGGGAGGGGGEGGCPDAAPHASFDLTLRSDDGEALPNDLTLQIAWSAGEEPLFVLDDPSTHLSLDEGSNVECEATEDEADQAIALRCEVWTTGPTEVQVAAADYLPIDETLTPLVVEGCDTYETSEVELVLEPEPPPEGDGE